MESMLTELNAAQHTAVTSPASVLQILAPPGSGKTKTLTSRVAHLLSYHHYKPWNILCLTFTIKSSREMKERIAKLIGNGMEAKLVLGTFHSVCRRYLARYGHLIGIKNGFGIADTSDTMSILKRITKRYGLNVDPRKAQSRISSSKSKGITCEDLARAEGQKKNVDQQQFIQVFEAYQSHLEQSNLLDYDDLLLRCVDLLRQHPACVSNIEAVLIDEFQDTNLVQFDLMRLFAGKHKRITTVGDPDQSIYGWRSAEIKNLRRMQKQYPDTLVIHLEDNYRSSGAIILAAREVIEQDEARVPRPLLPTHCPGTVPVLRRLSTAESEGLWIVSEIHRAQSLTGHLLRYSDFAILLRSASLSRHIEAAMGKAGIPYRMVGGQRFFDRLEIKILLDYLKVVSQPDHNDALARIINIPSRGVGPATIKTLLETAESSNVTLWHFIRGIAKGHPITKIKISKAAEQGLGSLIRIILTAVSKLVSITNPESPEQLLRYITKKLNFEEYLKKTHEQDYDTRWANVEELLAQAADYPVLPNDESANGVLDNDSLPIIDNLEQNASNPSEAALSKFLANVALATEIQREDEHLEGVDTPQSRVTISTIHAAKGLEWPVAFIPSAYDGSIPHSRAEDTDEERRLLYVAMTRAQALLYMSYPVKNSQREETTLSPFLSSKKVGHFLANRGPTFTSTTTQDIARILRRECPAEQTILESSRTTKNIEDDQWPLDGSENPDEAERRWNKWSTPNEDRDSLPPNKRCRVSDENAASTLRNLATTLDYTTHLTNATTMQNYSSFSYVGFTTAASQYQAIEAEAATSRSKIANKILEKQSRAPLGTKRSAGQSSLTTFLKPSNKPNNNSNIPATSYTTSLSGLKAAPRADRVSASENATISKVPATSHIEEAILAHPRRPLPAIPQTLAHHRLQPLSNTTRPHPHLADHGEDGEAAQKTYVFLSSSPPSFEKENDIDIELKMTNSKVENGREATCFSSTGTLSSTTNEAGARANIRPATTLHTTSMQQASTRRTLGVKRSMNGWAARGAAGGKKGFEVPKRVHRVE